MTRILSIFLAMVGGAVAAAADFAPESMAYVLQAEGLGKREAAVAALTECRRDLVVMDYAFYGDEETRWTAEEVEKIRSGKAGRKVAAYLSIGEAGTYRAYWKKAWDDDGDGRPDAGAPEWLLEANPDWRDNYKVRYWDEAWQRHVLEHLETILAAGFDGIYLDIVDAFEFFEHDPEKGDWIDHRENPLTGQTYREDMIAWVEVLAAAGRKVNPEFLVIPQNGGQLLEDAGYREVIDAIGVEDLFTNGNRVQKEKEVDYRMAFLKRALGAGMPVLAIEYGKKEEARAHSIAQAKKHGLGLLLTDRNLKTLGECPLAD